MHRASGYTRRAILIAIKTNGSMTADALGRALGVSPVAVRQHLAALEAEGLVATSVERRTVGRPVHRYAITSAGDETFPRTYDELANALLDEHRAAHGDAAVDELFGRNRRRLQAGYELRMEGRDLAARVRELARIQDEGGYMAEAREEPDGTFLLVEANCAICRVARRHPAVCEQELAMFRALLGARASIVRERHIPSGDTVCAYRVRRGRPDSRAD